MPYKDLSIRKQKSAERFKAWAKRNPKEANERMKHWRQRNPKYMLHASAKRRAKAKDIVFDITIDDIPEIPELCPIALIPIYPRDDGTKGPCDNSPTLDRKIPSKGYVKGNVFVISHRGNRWKSEMTQEDLLRILDYMNS